jgi:Rod binding domain-containing protein
MTISSSMDLFSGALPANRTAGAAKDFEGLLIGEILKSSHTEEDDDAGAAAIGFGEEQMARALSAGGGIGLAKTIQKGLDQASAAAGSST